MSNIISQYTKYQNKQCGRNGYYRSKEENIDIISPKSFGCFIKNRRNKK